MWTVNGKSIGEPMQIGSTVTSVDITHDWLFAGDRNGKVHKYRRSDLELSCDAKIHAKAVSSLKVARGFVFTASADRTAKMSEIDSLDIIRTFTLSNRVGRGLCITVGIDFFFVGGEEGAERLSLLDGAANATPIVPQTQMSHMALNGRSLFMTSKADDTGQVYFLRDAHILEEALISKVVFLANEPVRSLALGGAHLFVATEATIYKVGARDPKQGADDGFDVTPWKEKKSKVCALQVFGEIAVVGYFPGSKELGIFNTQTGCRFALATGAFSGHGQNINCIAVG